VTGLIFYPNFLTSQEAFDLRETCKSLSWLEIALLYFVRYTSRLRLRENSRPPVREISRQIASGLFLEIGRSLAL
jgi:hypothetical protein